MGSLAVAVVLSSMLAAQGQETGWECFRVHPWAVVTEEQLARGPYEAVQQLECWGLRNDWITTALGVRSTRESVTLTVAVETEGPLTDKVQLRIVGMGNSRRGGFVPDPLFAEGDFLLERPLTSYLSNWELISKFPTFTVTPEHPSLLWITILTKDVPAGMHKFSLRFSDGSGQVRTLPFQVEVLDAELPTENPLYSFLWSYVSGETWIREYIEHGVNVFHVEQEAAYRLGAKFLLFTAPNPAWKLRTPIDDAVRGAVRQGMQDQIQLVRRLGLKENQWAVYITDEPNEQQFPTVMEYARLLRASVDTFVPIYVTVPWTATPGTTRNETVSPQGIQTLADAKIVDVWQPYWYCAWDGSGFLDIIHRAGKPAWLYEILADVPRDPKCGLSFWRMGPWHAFKYGVQGIGVYSGYAPGGDPWNDCDGAHDYYVVYHYGPKGFLSTRAFEAWRQGIQEHKVLQALARSGAPHEWLVTQVDVALKVLRPEDLDGVRRGLAERLLKVVH